MQLAKQGKVIGMSYEAGVSTSDDVQKAWGSPTSQTSAGAGIYLTYTAHHAAFGFNKGDQIFDVRSFSPTLHAATLSEVQKVLGTPGIVRHTANERILLYPAGPDYQLLWIFPMPNASAPNPEVDHVSVFYPRGTIDMMAQDIPNPSVVMDQPPGSVGSLFTFSIKDAPGGYQLAELEWIPATGQAVVDTANEAIRHGASGGSGAYFQISGDGKTTGFVYTHAMKGQSGVVRLIYQNTNGAAIIGQSSRITLK
jgi:hypothetical protein